MDFYEATDRLFSRVTHSDLAKALGVSVASVRQARLKPEAAAHRGAPPDWRDAVISLAEQRVWHYKRLVEELHNDGTKAREA